MRKLVDAVRKVKANESMILLGDFNVHVGNDAGVCVVVIGKHGHSDVNSNGRCGMWIMNTVFQHRFFGSLLTHWFLHSFSWLVPISVGRSCQKSCNAVDGSPFDGVQLTHAKTNTTYCIWTTSRSKRTNWEVRSDNDVTKTFVETVSYLFGELPECLANRDGVAAVDLFAAQVYGLGLGAANNGKKATGIERWYSSKKK